MYNLWMLDASASTDMKQEILKRLDLLAEKLGTTATYLWHVLVKQGVAEGVQDCLIGLTYVVLLVLFWRIGIYLRDVRSAKTEYQSDKEGVEFLGWVVIFASQLFWLGIGTYLYQGIIYLINPEFYALQTILNSFK